ncbi:MAG: tyrosine-type recombinase/integrase [Bacilli bacterium]
MNNEKQKNRKKKKIVKFLELDQLKAFESPLAERAKLALSGQNMTVSDKIAVRDFALISLVYACALRISEACNLELSDVNLDEKVLYVFDGKGGDRTVSIPEPTINILREWLKIRPIWKGNEYFFTNIKGTTRPGEVKTLRPQYYNKLCNTLAEKTGILLRDGKKPHPHTLRHSRAMELYDEDTSLEVIQALLGHKYIATTQIYAEVRNKKIIEAQQSHTKGLVTI